MCVCVLGHLSTCCSEVEVEGPSATQGASQALPGHSGAAGRMPELFNLPEQMKREERRGRRGREREREVREGWNADRGT